MQTEYAYTVKDIFTMEEMIIALKGVLLSPSALSTQALILYAIVAVSPPKMI